MYRDGLKELRDLKAEGEARVAAGETVVESKFLTLLHHQTGASQMPIVVPAKLIREGKLITAAKASEGMGLSILASDLTSLAKGGGKPL